MLRQRLKLRAAPAGEVTARALVSLVAVALIWYGAMLVLLALKSSPSTINALSGYRDVYDSLSEIAATDIESGTRLIAALAGLAGAALFGYLAWLSLPRPHLARTALRLRDDDRGQVDVQPRAIERAVELAAVQAPSVAGARARYAEDVLEISIGVRRATELRATLADVQRRARDALARHHLPKLPVTVTLTNYDRKNRRELQ